MVKENDKVLRSNVVLALTVYTEAFILIVQKTLKSSPIVLHKTQTNPFFGSITVAPSYVSSDWLDSITGKNSDCSFA